MQSALSAQLEAATLELVGDGTLKDRLCAAFCDHLDDISELDLPESVQEEFAAMARVMHGARALPGDSVVRASIRKLSNEEAQRYAGLILRTYALRIRELASTARTSPRAASAPREGTARESTPLALLLALGSGTEGGTRPKRASRA
jgi:hypothetical protein